MWEEPLTAATRPLDAHSIVVAAYDATGAEVARVVCAYNLAAGCGMFGEMRVVDAAGAPRQRLRALALLVREALRFAAERGITQARTEAPPRLAHFARAISGAGGVAAADRVLIAGEIHALRTHALEHSDADGNVAGVTADEIDEAARSS